MLLKGESPSFYSRSSWPIWSSHCRPGFVETRFVFILLRNLLALLWFMKLPEHLPLFKIHIVSGGIFLRPQSVGFRSNADIIKSHSVLHHKYSRGFFKSSFLKKKYPKTEGSQSHQKLLWKLYQKRRNAWRPWGLNQKTVVMMGTLFNQIKLCNVLFLPFLII